MVEGDFGLALPFTVSGIELSATDKLKFTFKQTVNGKTMLEKVFENIENNTVKLEFSEEESALFVPGTYAFSLDWYQDGVFCGNLIENGTLKVVDKA
jgi:hypothetical protein